MKKRNVIYPSYHLSTGMESWWEIKFFPKTQFYHEGKKFILKLTWHPYPKVIDVISEKLLKSNLATDEWDALKKSLSAMELVYRSFDAMAQDWDSPFKIIIQEDAKKEKPKNSTL